MSDVDEAKANLVEDAVPGLKEVNAFKEEVGKAKDMSKVLNV
jgi:hypothetical protein